VPSLRRRTAFNPEAAIRITQLNPGRVLCGWRDRSGPAGGVGLVDDPQLVCGGERPANQTLTDLTLPDLSVWHGEPTGWRCANRSSVAGGSSLHLGNVLPLLEEKVAHPIRQRGRSMRPASRRLTRPTGLVQASDLVIGMGVASTSSSSSARVHPDPAPWRAATRLPRASAWRRVDTAS